MSPPFTRFFLLRGLLLAGVLLAGRPGAAQDVTLTGLDASVYRGFKTVEGQVYYMLRQGSTYDLFQLEIYGRDLQKKATTEVRLGRNWNLQATRVVGEFTYFYFFTGKEGLLLKLDATGKQVQEARFPGTGDYFGLAAMEPAGGGDFYITYPIDPGKLGFVVARYGSDLTAKRWQKEYLPEKGKYNVHQFQADATHAYAVLDNTKASYEVVCLDGLTGNETSRKELLGLGAPNLLVPNLASLDKAGHLILAGYYGNVPKSVLSAPVKVENATPTDGYFVLSLAPEGTPDYLSRLSFATELAGKLNTHSTIQPYTVGDYPGLKLHALLPRPGGGYALVGETYKMFFFTDPLYSAAGGTRAPGPGGAAGPGPPRRDVLDFVVLDLTTQGKLEAVRRIPKPYKIYEDHSAGPVPREFTDKLVYSYRFLYQPDPAKLPQVVFLNWHQNLLYVNTLKPATDVRDNIFTRRYLGQPAVPAGPDRGELTTLSFAPTFQTPPGEFFYDEVLPHAPGKFVYSHFDPAKSALHLQVLDVPVE
ncbi:hypothetical protein [Hymenobacter glaciei]|uniref:hypothetical protein n=1 Tax=Hymenobacter glaciei TaxID=877209 RepID=UPI0031EA1B67